MVNFTIKEYCGTEIFKSDNNSTLKSIDDIKAGDEITAFGCKMIIKSNDGLYCENDNLLGLLEFDKDDRKAWVCAGLINKRGVAKGRQNE